jgi:hypothetical protein
MRKRPQLNSCTPEQQFNVQVKASVKINQPATKTSNFIHILRVSGSQSSRGQLTMTARPRAVGNLDGRMRNRSCVATVRAEAEKTMPQLEHRRTATVRSPIPGTSFSFTRVLAVDAVAAGRDDQAPKVSKAVVNWRFFRTWLILPTMSGVGWILLQNSSSLDCGLAVRWSRSPWWELREAINACRATPTQGRPLPKVAGHGRDRETTRPSDHLALP